MKAVRTLKSQAGFSLIELMIVVAIIGILASIAVPNFKKFQVKARQSEAKAQLTSLYTAEKAFYGEWNSYFGDFRDVGYSPEGKMRYQVGFAGLGVAAAAVSTNFVPSTNGSGAGTLFNTAAALGKTGFTFTQDANIGAYSANAAGGSCAAGTNPTQTTFVASAASVAAALGADRTDVWAIDQAKNICNTQSGI